jgi:hypothetical protein
VAENMLRQAKVSAENRAEAARWGLAPYGSAVFDGALGVLETAWVSSSAARTSVIDTLVGAGAGTLGVFSRQAAAFGDEAGAEPMSVDPEDPVHGWKANSAQVQARVRINSANPYYGR